METAEDDNRGELPNVEEESAIKDEVVESKADSAESQGEDDEEDVEDDSKTTPEVQKGSERPTRERKLVKRYTESSPARAFFAKPVLIDKGRGTQLKDIPNVAFKLSKRKPDDNLQTLHSVMFGKRTKAHNLKKNLGLFSGYLWIDSEHDKQRGKVKEKLDKCIKEKLMDFCDVLNIPINKTNTKKEELCLKLLEFLECPRATTENLLSDKEKKGNKRKAKATGGKITGSAEAITETPTKKQKKNSQTGEKQKREEEEKEVGEDDARDNNGDHDADTAADESDTDVASNHESKPDPKPELEEEDSKSSMPTEENSVKKKSKPKNSVKENTPAKSTKKSANKTPSSRSKKNKVKEESEKDQIAVVAKEKKSRKKNESDKKTTAKKNKSNKEKVEAQSEEKSTLSAKDKTSNKNQASTSVAKVLENDSEAENGKKEPDRAEMYVIAEGIIKEADFNKVTLGDVVKQLGTHFGVDLMSRRDEVKRIIADILKGMSDDDESDSEEEKKDA